jgi:hypothetical protein
MKLGSSVPTTAEAVYLPVSTRFPGPDFEKGATLSPEAFRRTIIQWFYAAHQCCGSIALYPEHADLHRPLITSLISWGEWAGQELAGRRIDLTPIGVKLEDVQAETRILRDTYCSAFENSLSEAEAEAILKKAFG